MAISRVKKGAIIVSSLLGFVSSSIAVGVFLSPIINDFIVYTDEELERDKKYLREGFYVQNLDAHELLPITNTILSRSDDFETKLIRVVLLLETGRTGDAREEKRNAFFDQRGSQTRLLSNYYDLALELSGSSDLPTHTVFLVDQDTGSAFYGANITSDRIAELLSFVGDPWLLYPLMGRSDEQTLLFSVADTVIKESPDFSWGYVLRARSLFAALGDPMLMQNLRMNQEQIAKEIIFDTKIAIALNPDIASAYYIRARTLESQRDFEEAHFNYTRALEIDPGYCQAMVSRGVLHGKMSAHDRAVEDATSAIETCPEIFQAYQNRATAFYRLGEYQSAVADYSYLFENAPAPMKYVALHDRASTLLQTEFWQTSCRDFRTIESMADDIPTHIVETSWNGLGVCSGLEGEYEQSLVYFLRSIMTGRDELPLKAALNLLDAIYENRDDFAESGLSSELIETREETLSVLEGNRALYGEQYAAIKGIVQSMLLPFEHSDNMEERARSVANDDRMGALFAVFSLEIAQSIGDLSEGEMRLLEELRAQIRSDPGLADIQAALRGRFDK